ncbi:metal ABC transporter substrate-binding protein [Fervidobacterium islandicum]|uniref:Metal ABC transporter substrate-binding protein n=1 Tax=Fervidobacterium islandicum TaxID=2423 RepID=A0AAI8GDC0_FERIS|nr:metal ABC transporter substrate-binding protein [Fervidobacterium islandicum]AMW32854.1 metal ABC transporter substrate-binding protein [Fervidobacterium islandicum]
MEFSGRLGKFVIAVLLLVFFIQVYAVNIVATINPYYLIVKEIVGDKADVNLLIKPGSNPHVFNPTVSDVKTLSKADLIVANGLGLDNSYLKNYKNVLFVGEKVPKKYLSKSDEHDEHAENNEITYNPHVWLSIDFLTDYIIPAIRDELVKVDPQNARIYSQNANKIIVSLKEISQKFDKLFADVSKNKQELTVILEHPSYLYFFKKYNVKVLAVEEGHGKEPSAQHIKNIIAQAKKGNLLGIFVGPQFKTESIKVVAKELGRDFKILDPLGYNVKTVTELFENAYKSIREAAYGK